MIPQDGTLALVLAAFGVGLANFGRGLERSPRELERAIREVLPLVVRYGGTGNVVLSGTNIDEAGKALADATGTDWAVLPVSELANALDYLNQLPEPPHGVDERPTPGLAFAVAGAREGEVASTNRAFLERISHGIVAVRKMDLLQGGKLDRNRRRGGWGAVSAEIASQVGGRWTSRSRRPLDGLIARLAMSDTQLAPSSEQYPPTKSFDQWTAEEIARRARESQIVVGPNDLRVVTKEGVVLNKGRGGPQLRD